MWCISYVKCDRLVHLLDERKYSSIFIWSRTKEISLSIEILSSTRPPQSSAAFIRMVCKTILFAPFDPNVALANKCFPNETICSIIFSFPVFGRPAPKKGFWLNNSATVWYGFNCVMSGQWTNGRYPDPYAISVHNFGTGNLIKRSLNLTACTYLAHCPRSNVTLQLHTHVLDLMAWRMWKTDRLWWWVSFLL